MFAPKTHIAKARYGLLTAKRVSSLGIGKFNVAEPETCYLAATVAAPAMPTNAKDSNPRSISMPDSLQSRRFGWRIRRPTLRMAAGLVASFLAAAPASARSYHDIYLFDAPNDGEFPQAGLVMDAQGRLYGTTNGGGAHEYGTVFRLTPPISGQGPWTEEILHSFSGDDGGLLTAPVVLGADGSVYGTATYGGTGTHDGIAFKLTNAPGWPETILHNFANGLRGGGANTGLVFGLNGLLYSTTSSIGDATYAQANGTIFSVSPLGSSNGYQVVHTFGKTGFDGSNPVGLTAVSTDYFSGFVGATLGDTGSGFGTVFAEQIAPNGQSQESVLYAFQAGGLNTPPAAPTLGSGAIKGALFGCGVLGGTHGMGGVYSLTPTGDRGLIEQVLYNFGDQPHDPFTAAIGGMKLVQVDSSGKLVGVSYLGGAYGDGAFFELDPPTVAGGVWTEKVDVSFSLGDFNGGGGAVGAPLRHGGIYYGALNYSKYGKGAIYELTP